MERKRILFIVSPIKSHYIPSFYLARLLGESAYIYYTVFEGTTEELVRNQGYETIKMNSDRFGIGTERYNIDFYGNKISKTKRIINFLTNHIYKKRKKDLFRIVEKVKPFAIFIDNFSSTDFAVLYAFRSTIKFYFFNPMLSTYKVKGLPLINEEKWGSFGENNEDSYPSHLKGKISRVGLKAWIQFQRVYRDNRMSQDHPVELDNPFVYTFKNVPEIVLAPLELEFSRKVRKQNQYYFGTCIAPGRIDIQIDEQFDIEFGKILARVASEKQQLIYCSFGTYFNTPGEFRSVSSFILALIEALKNENALTVILALNEEIKEVLLDVAEIPQHFHLFKKVRQLDVLKYANAFITHGGLGSIKEAIFYKVPLLVYPLDKNWDQVGNAFKVEYHGIGLRGDIDNDEPEMILNKVRGILTTSIKERMNEFSELIKETYSLDYQMEVLEKLLKLNLETPELDQEVSENYEEEF